MLLRFAKKLIHIYTVNNSRVTFFTSTVKYHSTIQTLILIIYIELYYAQGLLNYSVKYIKG